MYFVIDPETPSLMESISVRNDTLSMLTNNSKEELENKFSLLYPIEKKKAFTSNWGARWKLDDRITLVDVSLIKNGLDVPEGQIGNLYFLRALELYLKEMHPSKKDIVLERYVN